eukprot:TRINITY_DN3765_c0_g2_i6.p1 TRINITY_DN3765_c0_g2~~TRINITY_DN3765_c0_g2_i6.p1  ORF type:complete len:164 (-),score=16.35 TRINITY_DN3765_c0_g2_i6:424-915(-)
MVFRGFVKEGLKFSTDLRSTKVQELNLHPYVELCWYFTNTREQFRVSGTVEVATSEHPLAYKVFSEEISPASRATFAWPEPAVGQLTYDVSADVYPTSTYPRELFFPPSSQTQEHCEKAMKNFGLILLRPSSISHAQLLSNQFHQYTETSNGEWVLNNSNSKI